MDALWLTNQHSYRWPLPPKVELSPEQKALYPELTQLQEQLRSVQDAELKLRQHIVYQVLVFKLNQMSIFHIPKQINCQWIVEQESSADLTPGAGQIGFNYWERKSQTDSAHSAVLLLSTYLSYSAWYRETLIGETAQVTLMPNILLVYN